MAWLALLAAALLAFSVVTAAGCGGEADAAEWLRMCGQAVSDYAAAGGYLRFQQESRNALRTAQASLESWMRVEGEIILPEREKYEYREELTSPSQPEKPAVSAFSYLTVDGGKTAYVAGETISAQLGLTGWVHYTPPQGQSRFFDYLKIVERITGMGGSAEWLGYEEIRGVRCGYLSLRVSGREIMDLRLQEDPTLAEKYPELAEQEFTGEILVRLWIAAESRLPVRVVMESSAGEGEEVTSGRVEILFSGYHEEPPSPIEAPGAFIEAG